MGFGVFWDLETRAGPVRGRTEIAGYAIASAGLELWSCPGRQTRSSPTPQKTQADEAKRANKLIAVRLDEAIDTTKLPLGHDRLQMPYVGAWPGESADPVWTALLAQIEERATPPWVRQKPTALEEARQTEILRRTRAEATLTASRADVEKPVVAQAAHREEMEQAANQSYEEGLAHLDEQFEQLEAVKKELGGAQQRERELKSKSRSGLPPRIARDLTRQAGEPVEKEPDTEPE